VTDDLVARNPEGSVTVPAATLCRIVVDAAELVDGVRVRRPRRGVSVELAEAGAAVSLQLTARYGTVLPVLAREVQERVGEALARMCALSVLRVDVAIEELVAR
jgi:uncharacterized alkaline shock family protein YloU